ncbi:hypothetical protein QA601_15380 [Chitinispirillales bacterium ANBcel5]|uniref:hypothetical protein n=1 Tax=Cellulosispirillum alkaliphilum TaxID=3039283 RepID=UPI002A5036CD|nr:hypothetical protein [Chitinispirillales bacterium ANBcel5]
MLATCKRGGFFFGGGCDLRSLFIRKNNQSFDSKFIMLIQIQTLELYEFIFTLPGTMLRAVKINRQFGDCLGKTVDGG